MSQKLFNSLQENREKTEEKMEIAYLELISDITETSMEIHNSRNLKTCKEQNLLILLIVTLKTILKDSIITNTLGGKLDLRQLSYYCFVVNRLNQDLKGNHNLLTIEELKLKTFEEVEVINNTTNIDKLFIFQIKILNILIEGLEEYCKLDIDIFYKAFYENFNETLFQDIQAALFLLNKITERLVLLSPEDSDTNFNIEEDKTKN